MRRNISVTTTPQLSNVRVQLVDWEYLIISKNPSMLVGKLSTLEIHIVLSFELISCN